MAYSVPARLCIQIWSSCAVRNVVYESLRLYPPADVLGREALNDITIKCIDIKKGMNIFASTWVLHRDPRFFTNPEQFDPARWTDDFEKSSPDSPTSPSAAARFCIGQSFAVIEATLALAAIIQRASSKPAPDFRLELWPAITCAEKWSTFGRGPEKAIKN